MKKQKQDTEKICGIYKITSPTGKSYIGQSTDVTRRWKQYKALQCKTQTKLYNSLLSHGPEIHTFDVLEECKEEALNERELYWGDFFDSIKNGLNLTLGNQNRKVSKETREKIKKAKTGKPNPGTAGRKRPESEKQNISATVKSLWETGQKKGHPQSEETRQKISQSKLETHRKKAQSKLQKEETGTTFK